MIKKFKAKKFYQHEIGECIWVNRERVLSFSGYVGDSTRKPELYAIYAEPEDPEKWRECSEDDWDKDFATTESDQVTNLGKPVLSLASSYAVELCRRPVFTAHNNRKS